VWITCPLSLYEVEWLRPFSHVHVMSLLQYHEIHWETGRDWERQADRQPGNRLSTVVSSCPCRRHSNEASMKGLRTTRRLSISMLNWAMFCWWCISVVIVSRCAFWSVSTLSSWLSVIARRPFNVAFSCIISRVWHTQTTRLSTRAAENSSTNTCWQLSQIVP